VDLKTQMARLSEYAKELSVLYVEDEEALRAKNQAIFERFFKEVVGAKDGEEGLLVYNARCFDIVITDINMPKMNGVEMTKAIKAKEPDQLVIIISAHNEVNYLLDLINVGTDGFLTKPTGTEQLVMMLAKMARIASERKLVDGFHEKLESSYVELMEKNDALEKALTRAMHAENNAIALAQRTQESDTAHDIAISDEQAGLLAKAFDAKSALEFWEEYPGDLERKSEILEAIEDQFEEAIMHFESNTKAGEGDIIALLKAYADAMNELPEFSNLTYAIDHLATVMEGAKALDHKRVGALLYGIASGLEAWRKVIFVERNTENIHYLDNSLINDTIVIKALLEDAEVTRDDGNDELELF